MHGSGHKLGRGLGAALCVGLAACGSAPLPELRAARVFVVQCEIASAARGPGASLALPLPVDDEDQELRALEVEAEGGVPVERFDSRGNRRVAVSGEGPLSLRWRAVVARFERAPPPPGLETGATARRARPGASAREVLVVGAGRPGVLGKARALFDAILDERLAPAPGDRTTRLAASLAKLAIRVRVEHGLLLPSGVQAHWLRFLVPGIGWLAADPARDIDAGRLDAGRLALGSGTGPSLPAGARVRAREIGGS